MKKITPIAIIAILLLSQVGMAQSRRSDRKIIEMSKIIKLHPQQEEKLRLAYEENAERNDSILYEVTDAALAAKLKYESDKKLKQTIMSTLTNPQRNAYIRVTSTPEVQAKAAARVAELHETGDYTPAQLDSAQTQIFEYLMLEKVVYVRDKYDYRKQKENIRLLKTLEPVDLKKANAREKMRTQGKSVQGKVQW